MRLYYEMQQSSFSPCGTNTGKEKQYSIHLLYLINLIRCSLEPVLMTLL